MWVLSMVNADRSMVNTDRAQVGTGGPGQGPDMGRPGPDTCRLVRRSAWRRWAPTGLGSTSVAHDAPLGRVQWTEVSVHGGLGPFPSPSVYGSRETGAPRCCSSFPLAPLFPDGVSRRWRADKVPAENPRHEGRTQGGVIGLGPAAGKCWKGLSFGCLVEGLRTAGRLTRVGLDAGNVATLL